MSRLLKLVFILYLVSISTALDSPSCATITSQVTPCASYIRNGGSPSTSCCKGVVDVAKMATTKQDKVAICDCLKTALKPIGAYDPSRIPPLAKSCGAKINLPAIDQNYDCSKVSHGGVF